MLKTYVSSNLERLVSHFADHLSSGGEADDPFAAAFESRRDPVVIYPNSAVRELLRRSAADRSGVAAGIEWAAPASIVSRATKGISDQDVFGSRAAWMIYRLLDSLRGTEERDDDFAVLKNYSGRTDRDLFDLSKRIQALLAAYAVYRPEWIQAWAQGRDPDAPKVAASPHAVWQKKLVRRLVEEGLSTDLIRRADEAISTSGRYWRNRQVILFAPLSVSPRLERFLQVISDAGADVAVYLHGAEAKPSDPDGVMSLYLQHAESLKGRFSAFGPVEILDGAGSERNLLTAMQKGAAGLNAISEARRDESFCVVRASSLTRELETFADRLQMLFQTDPTLALGDVMLLFPDIDAAVPSLHSVFGRLRLHEKSSSPMLLPLRITGMARPAGDTLADGLPALLRLAFGDCSREDFTAWLMHPAVMKGLGLSLDDVGLMDGWLRAAGFAAGINPRHLNAVEHADRHDDRTLASAMERLTAFYALGDVKRLPIAEDVLPTSGLEAGEWDTVTERPDLLHMLCTVSECLSALAAAAYDDEAVIRRPVASGEKSWQDVIIPVGASLFPDAEQNEWKALNGLFAEIGRDSTVGGSEPLPLSLELLTLAFEDRVRTRPSVSRNSDVITAGPLKTLYGLPKRVTAIFGLSNGCGFCEEKVPDEFDLLRFDDERPGDRNSAAEDRHRFVTTMLAASDILHLSYTGSGLKGAVDNPSVVVKDMLSSAEETGTVLKVIDESVSALLPRAFMAEGENPAAPSRSWKSTDARLAALFDAASEPHRPTPVAPMPDLGRTPEGFTDFLTMKTWLMKPAVVILRALRLPHSSYEAETADTASLTDESALSEFLRRTKLLEDARSGFTDEDLISVWLADPMIGVKKLRRKVVEKDVEEVRAVISAASVFRAEQEGKGAVRTAVRLTVPLGSLPEETVVHTIDEVWMCNSGAVIFSKSMSKAPLSGGSPTRRGHAALYDLLVLQAAFECGNVEPVNPAAESAAAYLADRIRSAPGRKISAREKSVVSVAFCSPAKEKLVERRFTFCPPKMKTYPEDHPDPESVFEAISGRRLLKAFLELFLYARMHPDQLVYADEYQMEAFERLTPGRGPDPKVYMAVANAFASIPASQSLINVRDSAVASLERLFAVREQA